MNVKELREYLVPFPESAKVEVVIDNRPTKFEMAWGGADGGTKATAIDVAFVVGGIKESA